MQLGSQLITGALLFSSSFHAAIQILKDVIKFKIGRDMKYLKFIVLYSVLGSLFSVKGFANEEFSFLSPIFFDDSSSFIDIRAVGDSGWARNGRSIDKTSSFGERLREFDAQGEILIGDLNFMNWESSISGKCFKTKNTLLPRAFSFISHPDAFEEALKFGFNLFNLSNNHSRDCYQISRYEKYSFEESERETLNYISDLSKYYDFIFHGMSKENKKRFIPKVFTIEKNGTEVSIAFNSVYSHPHASPVYCKNYANCIEHGKRIMENLKKSKADIKILSIHSEGGGGHKKAKRLARKFIKNFDGDIVFSHGSHRIELVEVLSKFNGNRGVIFHGLGNFLHPGLQGHKKNMMGRVLVDLETKKIAQIQSMTLRGVQGQEVDAFVEASSYDASKIPANFKWSKVDHFLRDGYGRDLSWAYFNL